MLDSIDKLAIDYIISRGFTIIFNGGQVITDLL